ncbi:hypothetical protein [Mucilaginibacter ginsenosidivorax]|uniref:Uncharacterized protein n=1 Tax=Mucilaginibacter ginsenosidivorax TaxID=862126 RepID=A0A5B8W3T2_9SPHI|nr:hypothetical protein [Mucilaginibacter ginsenosidivorax]QEC78057.1 hypothetical protein FSB76_19715 [Mucilaginibacter ginsenosidivorax]
MKKHFLITFILSMAVNCGYAQDFTFKPRSILTKLTAADSLRWNSSIAYFTASPPAVEGFILSVDQTKVDVLHGPLYDGAREYYVQVPVKLTNTSDDTLRYLSMSCSWWDIYRTDHQKIKIFSPNSCYKNSPITCIVPPHQFVIRNIIVLVPKEMASVIFKIGMTVQRKFDNGLLKDRFLLSSIAPTDQHVIWSDYVLVSQWKTKKSK